MKKYFVIFALLVCFRNIQAQTTVGRTTVYHRNTVEVHPLITTIDSTILKTVKYNEVSRSDADGYLMNGRQVSRIARSVSLLHGPLIREMVVIEKENGLHYAITCRGEALASAAGALIGIPLMFMCAILSFIRAIVRRGYIQNANISTVLAPLLIGMFSFLIFYSANSGFHPNWDEQITYPFLGIVVGVGGLLFNRMTAVRKSYAFQKKKKMVLQIKP
jgi:hypothetical protein